MANEYSTKKYKTARAELLADNPLCHWCKRAPATELDHLIETDKGGSIDDGYVAACKPCNSRRGAQHLNNRRANQVQARNQAMTGQRQNQKNTTEFLDEAKPLTPTPFSRLSKKGHDSIQDSLELNDCNGLGRIEPRLVTPTGGYESYGPLVVDFARRELGIELFEWQARVLHDVLQHDQGVFVHSTAIASTARQNGKSFLVRSLVAFALLELPRIWGRPVSILTTAHELSLAAEVFEALRDKLELWEESGLCKVTWAYGRQKVQMVDGSVWKVLAATGKKHGGTYDIIVGDELWALTEATVFGALRPSQIAVPSPLMYLTSTAGDESSTAYLKLREQALGIIDSGVPSDLYMAEWSLPDGVDVYDERYWGYANPSLGRTITMKGLRSASHAPDQSQYIRAHQNKWVSAASSWMPHGMWSKRRTDFTGGEGGYLAVDSATDGSKYVGIWARPDHESRVVVSVAFTTESNFDMWHEISRLLDADPKLKLAITPSLHLHTPEKYKHRTTQWGYGELLKWTGLIRSFIIEGRVVHTGEQMLSEHVNRAVLVKAENSQVVSSQRSAGPIECARCMIVAAALVSAKPVNANRAAMGTSR